MNNGSQRTKSHQNPIQAISLAQKLIKWQGLGVCVEMEKEEQKWEQTEVEEQEEEETSLLVRKSRAENDSKAPEIAAAGVKVGNGISETNGCGIQSKGAENGAKNEEPTLEKELKIEELDGFLENELEAINGEPKIEELDVVLGYESEAIDGEQKIEELDGVLGNESEAINGEQKIEELDGVPENNSDAINGEHKSKNLVFYDEVEEKQISKDPGLNKLDISSLEFVANSTSAINGEDLKNNTLTSSSLRASQISYQEHGSSYIKSSNEIESAEVDLINEDDLDATDYDVERVIQKQNTHDLYCPNCNSCITRRVTLRKRKHRTRITDEEVKRNKIGAGSVRAPSGQVHHTDEVGFDDTEIRREDDDEERGRGPAIFKCLSCFSIFIPTRKGFQLLFGDKSGKVTVRDKQVPSVKKNWFISLFASNKQDTAVEQGSSSQTDVQKGDVGVGKSSNLSAQSGQPSILQEARSPTETSEGEDKILPFPRQKPSLNGKVVIGGGDKLDTTAAERIDATMEPLETYNSDQLKESKSRKEVENDYSVITPPKRTQVTNGESSEDAISSPKQDGLKFLIFSNKGSADEGRISGDSADVDGKLNVSVAIPHQEQDVRATILTDSVVENKYTNFKSSNSGRFYPTEMSQHTVTETKFELHSGELLKVDNVSAVNGASVAQGKDAVINIDAQPAGPSQPMQGTIHSTESASPLQSATQIITTGGERTEARKEFEIEVVKSIVYGGLAESITSLSVVSSAAAGGAATLNILALGMANLIGGLFIVCHNLWELKSDRIEEVSNQISNHGDRYKQLLGRRENFILHSIVAIISYIIFGLVPPLVYGFSFRKTDDKELKLLVVAASSLLCIVLLAIGRAYVRRPPKPYLQSVTTFVILGFMVSGVSYAAGILVERLLEKLGLFESSSVSNLLMPEMAKGGSAWASY